MSRDFSIILESLPDAYVRVYEALYTAAYSGEPCPSNIALAVIGGVSARSAWAAHAVGRLEEAGLIKVVRGRTSRIVILPFGQSTAGFVTDVVVPFRRSPAGSAPTPQPQEPRTSCFYCGVVSTHGCEHQRELVSRY